ncbi:ABC transporter substrate-binding protein [Luteimonas marina]|uniref:ABC transporter substrate-binding protein n=1 Tax=Luteimonas marina TaxID=488485 RepID=A0A5C5TZP1_9GAMM|nr:ABC transporter substrate-binding protein [Luteimonas marina]TWT18715.1 ABC transporter substrate-binding protein [Luteimonas marina]
MRAFPAGSRPSERNLRGVLAMLGLAMCMVSSSASAAAHGAIRVAANADIRSLDPGMNRDSNTDSVMMHLVEGLVAYGEDGTPRPMLAERVETSPDGRVVTFHLRKDVPFHNGQLMTARHVAWNWERYLDPRNHWPCLPEMDGSRGPRVESVEALDAHTVVFRLDRRSPMLLAQMAAVQCGAGAILHPDSMNAEGEVGVPIGTGPYRLGTWKRGEFIELVAFPGYRSRNEPRDGNAGGKIAYAHTIRWLVIRDDASRRAALIKGQVDVLPWLSAPELVELRKYPRIGIKSSPTLGSNVLLIQSDDPVMSDPLLRRALAHSLDVKAIAEVVSGGIGTVDASMVPVVSSYYSEAQRRGHDFNPGLARALLARSAYKGQKIRLLTSRRYTDIFDQSIMIQSMARQVGIHIDLVVLEWATQLDRYQSGNYQLMSFSYSPRVDPCLTYEAMAGNRKQSKRKVWDNPRALTLLADACGLSEPPARQAAFDELHQLMLRDNPLIVLFNPGAATAVRDRLEGFAPWPLVRERLWGVKPVATP